MLADQNSISEAHIQTPIGLLHVKVTATHLISIQFFNKFHSKLAALSEVVGSPERKPAAYIEVREELSTGLTNKFTSAVEFHQTPPLMQEVIHQLQHYFQDAKHVFDLPFCVKGTSFQKDTWNHLRKIPSGEVRTYGGLANLMQTSPRAIGNACRVNPLLLITPCHRVVAKDDIGGFSGEKSGHYRDMKAWLLRHEIS